MEDENLIFNEIALIEDPQVKKVLLLLANNLYNKISNLQIEIDTCQNRYYDLRSELSGKL